MNSAKCLTDFFPLEYKQRLNSLITSNKIIGILIPQVFNDSDSRK